MNKQKLKSWMMTQSMPLYACIYENGYYGGRTFTTPNPQNYDIYPDVYTAQHDVAKENWENYIETFPEHIDELPPMMVSLSQSLGQNGSEVLLPKTRKRNK